ncbi:hypothetical protein ACFLZZ_00995 [Nanoarchaeota archaeon]
MVNMRFVEFIRKGRKKGAKFSSLKEMLLKKKYPKKEVDEAINFVINEERKKKTFMFIGTALLIIGIALYFSFLYEKPLEGSVEEIETPDTGEVIPAPELSEHKNGSLNEPKIIESGSSGGGGGGGGGGGFVPAPAPVPDSTSTPETNNETAGTNSTIPLNETTPIEPTNGTEQINETNTIEPVVDEPEPVDDEPEPVDDESPEPVEEEEEEEEEEPINLDEQRNYVFRASMKSSFSVEDMGQEETLIILKNSSGMIDVENNDLYQQIKSFAALKSNGERASYFTETYFKDEISYQHLMFNGINEWIKITPETNKSVLARLGIKEDYFTDQSGLSNQFDLIDESALVPVNKEKCNTVLLAKKKSANKFMDIINRMFLWPMSKLKYKFGIGAVVKENSNKKNEKCRIKIVADKKIMQNIAADLFEQTVNNSDAVTGFIKYNQFSFAYKKALKNFELEYELDDQSRISKVTMDSVFDFDKKNLEAKEPKGRAVPFNTKARIQIITEIFGYNMQSPIVLSPEAQNATEIEEFLMRFEEPEEVEEEPTVIEESNETQK